jgi:deoxyribodipyrimidine photo-lyase
VPSLLWFRRDLRLWDNPALLAALAAGSDGCLPLFVVDPALWRPAGDVRRAYLVRSLRALDHDLAGALHVRRGAPVDVVPRVAQEIGAGSVHAAADFGPYGARRDEHVAAALGSVPLVYAGSPYAVSPGRLRTATGSPYSVFTPFQRSWLALGWRPPAPAPVAPRWLPAQGEPPPDEPDLGDLVLPPAGEAAARARWRTFVETALPRYAEDRDRPDRPGTSAMSHHLRWGEIHPRTMLADLDDSPGAGRYRTELAWREFYADVLHHRPASARTDLRPVATVHDPPGDAFVAWTEGRTGYPFVDAGMRQLRAEGWLHNRLRMVAASFLVKDLHVAWQYGARHFLRWLRDGDLASNQHGWQWAAGTGTDAAPYVRVFNPVTQGQRFDPDGAYVRRHVPELRHLPGASAHQPWTVPDGYAHGYPARIVDHAEERVEALRRLADARQVPRRA